MLPTKIKTFLEMSKDVSFLATLIDVKLFEHVLSFILLAFIDVSINEYCQPTLKGICYN